MISIIHNKNIIYDYEPYKTSFNNKNINPSNSQTTYIMTQNVLNVI